MKCFFILTLIVFLFIPCIGQEVEEKEKVAEDNCIEAWVIPSYMLENLQVIIDEFNRVFTERIEFYKKELKDKYKGYENMPTEVVFDGKDSFVIQVKIKKPGGGNEKK